MLLTFPSRYWFAIGLLGVFSLSGWAPMIRTGFLVSRPTQDLHCQLYRLPVRGCHPLRRAFPDTSGSLLMNCSASYNSDRAATPPVWALSSSLATTKDIDLFFLFLQVLRCFSSLRLPLIYSGVQASPARVAPFGHSRVFSCLLITVTFRSLPRPSSPPEA